MPDEKLIFDNSYVASDKETRSESQAEAAAKKTDELVKVESERYTKGKPYRILLRGRLVRDEPEGTDD